MAQIDIKKTTIRFTDGRKATKTLPTSGSADAKVAFTDQSTHRGTRPAITVAFVIAGTGTALSVVVTGTDIVVNLATDGGGLATTTAAGIKTAVDASGAASALVSTSLPGSGAVVPIAVAATALATGPHFLALKIAEGVVTYTEKKPRKYTKDRGLLSAIMNADEEPMDVKINAIWEFVTGDGSGTPTPEDVVKNRNDASSWTSSDADPCNPFSVDVEIEYNPNCGVKREFLMLEDFRYEDLGHMLKEGVIDFAGKCNHTEAFAYRIT